MSYYVAQAPWQAWSCVEPCFGELGETLFFWQAFGETFSRTSTLLRTYFASPFVSAPTSVCARSYRYACV